MQPARSTPTAPLAPPPADSASRPPSTSQPQNTGVDSTLKELERVKADALNARTSEATVRGQLASAQAELQRTKDAAGRATKEAEQAKDDAQNAREAQARAEKKLADAEAARSAAEERLKASEDAAKNERGFGAWLRGLFGQKPSNQ
jgi:chromosome segregation ATPase